MISKTPKFDKALDEYFSKLELDEKGGQWRTCRFSGEKFYVRPEDIEFYKKIRVPLPTLSPSERIRRKLAFQNSYNLYYVVSAFSGEKILSQYPANTPYSIYEHQTWFGENWEPRNYAREYNASQDFFKQFKELQHTVPRPNLQVDNTSVNSDYTNNSARLKNCYLVFDSIQAEDSAYSIALSNSRNCFDNFSMINSDTCFDCFENFDLYNCFFAEYSRNCLDSCFLYDCRNCTNCFGGVNLRHKKYVFFNERLTKKEYKKKIASINLGDREVLESLKNRFAELKKKAIHKETHNERSVGSFGDYLRNSKNCYACFYNRECENLSYSIGGIKNRDSYDLVGGVGTEMSYDSWGRVNNYGIKFSINSNFCRDIEYCDLCTNISNCFGCIGLKNKSFCIFNRQYTEKEYWALIDKIKTKMLKDGKYGEFFPQELSTFPYNISIATSYMGYDNIETAKKYGYSTEKVPENLYDASKEVLDSESLPKDIKDVGDDILDKIIFDGKNEKKFSYTKQEIDFYRKHNLPLPQEHFSIRLAEKRKKIGSIVLSFYERECQKCGKKIQSSYASDRPETVYCESCYLREVI